MATFSMPTPVVAGADGYSENLFSASATSPVGGSELAGPEKVAADPSAAAAQAQAAPRPLDLSSPIPPSDDDILSDVPRR
jgi:hypothetical protein